MPNTIVVLSGPPGSGKTTACRQLVRLVRQRGLPAPGGGALRPRPVDCAGLLSLPRFDGTRKAGIDLLDLRSGASRPLACACPPPGPRGEAEGRAGTESDRHPGSLRVGAYRFEADTLAWGADVLEAALPCDLLIVDELGPLELERGQGWVNALNVLQAGGFALAVVVVRPELLDAFRRVMSGVPLHLLTLPSPPGTDLPAAILSLLDRSQ